jgi:hypothetical protein
MKSLQALCRKSRSYKSVFAMNMKTPFFVAAVALSTCCILISFLGLFNCNFNCVYFVCSYLIRARFPAFGKFFVLFRLLNFLEEDFCLRMMRGDIDLNKLPVPEGGEGPSSENDFPTEDGSAGDKNLSPDQLQYFSNLKQEIKTRLQSLLGRERIVIRRQSWKSNDPLFLNAQIDALLKNKGDEGKEGVNLIQFFESLKFSLETEKAHSSLYQELLKALRK